MAKLRTLKPTIKAAPSIKPRLRPPDPDERMTGRRLQDRRLKMWTKSPCCARCGMLTEYPYGFELDHVVRLADGGPDTEDNCQVLCVWYEDGEKRGCHVEKSASEGESSKGRLGWWAAPAR